MTKKKVEEIFDELDECLDFHCRNAENKEDLIERFEEALYDLKEKLLKETE